MKLALLLCLAPQAQPVDVALPEAPFEVAPRKASWDELGEAFKLYWRLPFARPGREADDLLPRLDALVVQRDGEAPDPRLASFAALVDAVRAAGDDGPRVLEELLTLGGPVADGARGLAEELLADATLRTDAWSPEDAAPRDGVAELPAIDVDDLGARPWRDLGGTDTMNAAAVLVFADLEAITAVEHDFRGYLDHPGATYEEIGPKPGSYLRGVDERGDPFAAVVMRFRSDLPFPFGGYRADVHMLHRFDEAGRLTTDLYASSKDFHWLAGQDVYWPLLREDGSLVAYLLVRRYGFDLKGVPEKDAHRWEALRGSLGNIKRDAERAFERSGRTLEHRERWLPEFRVLGPPEDR